MPLPPDKDPAGQSGDTPADPPSAASQSPGASVSPDQGDEADAKKTGADGNESEGEGERDATGLLLHALADGFGLLERAREQTGDGDGAEAGDDRVDVDAPPALHAVEAAEDEPGDAPAVDLPAVLPEEVAPIMEALLFVSSTPLSPDRLRTLMGLDSIVPIRRAADRLVGEYDHRGRAFELVERAGGYVLQTRAEFEKFVIRLRRARQEQRMTHAALVTLSIIAYKQPITRSELDAIRGAGSSHHIRSLVERGLVRVVGRRPTPGNPSLYGTTSLFLRVFGLKSLRDLPQEADFAETDVEALRASALADTEPGGDAAMAASSTGTDAPEAAGDAPVAETGADEAPPETGDTP